MVDNAGAMSSLLLRLQLMQCASMRWQAPGIRSGECRPHERQGLRLLKRRMLTARDATRTVDTVQHRPRQKKWMLAAGLRGMTTPLPVHKRKLTPSEGEKKQTTRPEKPTRTYHQGQRHSERTDQIAAPKQLLLALQVAAAARPELPEF